MGQEKMQGQKKGRGEEGLGGDKRETEVNRWA